VSSKTPLILTSREVVPFRRGRQIHAAGRRVIMRFEALKVGELARRTGLTVRTLHHYDEIGLLRPSLHTGSGHRLYAAEVVARLQLIVWLRQLGFSLEQVRAALDRADFSPLEVIRLH